MEAMASTIFTAPEYDARREKKRKLWMLTAFILVVILGLLIYIFRNWPQEHEISKFMTALQQQQYEQAYGIWLADKDWKAHPGKYSNYSFNDFYQDWGPSGKYGIVHNFAIDGSARPGNGVVVQLTINGRREPEQLWVGKDNTITVWPYPPL